MMQLEELIAQGLKLGASDLHVEPLQPIAMRIRGELRLSTQVPNAEHTEMMARVVLQDVGWRAFSERGSADLSLLISGVRCRINVLRSMAGVGLVVRLLSRFAFSVPSLNLHPSLSMLMKRDHGLILITGPTGSGKSTTMSALIEEVNARESRHVLTIESPIEYVMESRKCIIRQREVGRDTPTVQQGLLDSLREDPDILMVGEMRDPETMQLTLRASETGHLVLATMHSATTTEALQRLVGAFSADIQGSVLGSLGDALVAVISQTLVYNAEHKMLVPECEVLIASSPVRAIIRSGNLSQLKTAIETGGHDGSFSFARYRAWLQTQPLANKNIAASDSSAAKVPAVAQKK